MVGFIINENLHAWELEGESLGFRTNRKYSTSDAVSRGRSIRLENWSSSDLTEENLEFQKPMDSVFSSRKFPRLCWEMHPPTPTPPPNLDSLMDEHGALGVTSLLPVGITALMPILSSPSQVHPTGWKPACLSAYLLRRHCPGYVLVSTLAWISYEEVSSKLRFCNRRINRSLLLLPGVLLSK